MGSDREPVVPEWFLTVTGADMSFAILELDIRQPAATVHRYGRGWYVRCDRCGRRCPLVSRLSLALDLHWDHAQRHVENDREDLEDLLDTLRLPLEVVAA